MTDDSDNVIVGSAWCAGAVFEGEISLNGLFFSGEADFRCCRFSGKTSFQDTHFGLDAKFDAAIFEDRAEFHATKFDREASFNRTHFSSTAMFTGVEFKGVARFHFASFGDFERANGAAFVASNFHSLSSFNGTTFQGTTIFLHTEFKRSTSFEYAAFGLMSNISNITFPTGSTLGPIFALGTLVFNSVTFPESMTFEVSAARVCCTAVNFTEGVTFRARWAELAFDRSTFGAASTITSAGRFRRRDNPSPFTAGLEPSDVEISLEQAQQDFNSIEEAFENARLTITEGTYDDGKAKIISLRQVDVSNIELVDVDLTTCLLAGAVNLDQIGIQGEVTFSSSPRGMRLGLGWPPLWRWTRRQVLTEEKMWRSVGISHRNKDLKGIRRTTWQGHDANKMPNNFFEVCGLRTPEVIEPIRLIATYRALRKAFEDRKNEPGAADFYYGEMEMRRLSLATPLAERFILTLYWLIAGYGLRALRSLVTLAIFITAVATILHFCNGITNKFWSYWDSLVFAAGQGVSLANPSVLLTVHGIALTILLRVITPLLLGLGLLSIRNRVKR